MTCRGIVNIIASDSALLADGILSLAGGQFLRSRGGAEACGAESSAGFAGIWCISVHPVAANENVGP